MRVLLCILVVSGCRAPDFTTRHRVAVFITPCGDYDYPSQEDLELAYDYYLENGSQALGVTSTAVRGAVFDTELTLRCGPWPDGRCGYRVGDTIEIWWDVKWDFILFHEHSHIARERETGDSDSHHRDIDFWKGNKAMEITYVEGLR